MVMPKVGTEVVAWAWDCRAGLLAVERRGSSMVLLVEEERKVAKAVAEEMADQVGLVTLHWSRQQSLCRSKEECGDGNGTACTKQAR